MPPREIELVSGPIIGVRDGVSGAVDLPPKMRADTTFVRGKDNTFV